MLIALFCGMISLSAQGMPEVKFPPRSVKVPAISGIVVDAITGKPVSGVDVILRAKCEAPDKQLRPKLSIPRQTGGFGSLLQSIPRPNGPSRA